MDSVLQTMVNEQIGPGEISSLFTSTFAEKCGCSGAVAFRTYPDCIEKALGIAGVTSESIVAISPLAPDVYKGILDKIGCQVVLADVDKENGLVSEKEIQRIQPDVLILYENCGSLPLKYNTETTYADKCDYSSTLIIEDVTQSLGGRFRDEAKPGDWGKIVICALEEDNIVSSAGGAVMAVKPDMVSSLRGKRPSSYLRLPDLNAALGLIQLQNLEENCTQRRLMFKNYQQRVGKTKHKAFGLNLLDFENASGNFAVFLDSRPDETIKFAEKHDVPVIRTFENSMVKFYEEEAFDKFPVSAAFYYRTVSFPLYPFLKATDVENISKVIAHLP